MEYGVKCVMLAQNRVSPLWLCSLSSRCPGGCLAFNGVPRSSLRIAQVTASLDWHWGTAGQLNGCLSSSEGVGSRFNVGHRI